LIYPDFDKPFKLQTDANDLALDAVLVQEDDQGAEHPVTYVSRKLTELERKYETREKEALAILWACELLRCYRIGRHFTIENDHRNLLWLMKYHKPGRLSHWVLRLQEYDFSLKYRPRKSNSNADVLSRINIPDSDLSINAVETRTNSFTDSMAVANVVTLPSIGELCQAQEQDPLMGRLLRYSKKTGSKTPEVRELLSGVRIYEIAETGLLTYSRNNQSPRIIIPLSARRAIMRTFHDIPTAAHLVQNKLFAVLKNDFSGEEWMCFYSWMSDLLQKKEPPTEEPRFYETVPSH
jgi:hypothetical protein